MKEHVPQVAYIGGYGRSGTTILATLLGMHPSAISVGEISKFFKNWIDNSKCTCGKPVQSCPFWESVYEKYITSINIPAQEAKTITLAIESRNPLWQNVDAELAKQYGEIWNTFFGAISSVSQKPIIVDKSGLALRRARRPLSLRQFTSIPIKMVHLVRDPRGVMQSTINSYHKRKKRNRHKKIEQLIGPGTKAILSWSASNLIIELAYHDFDEESLLRLSYEQFVAQIRSEIRKISTYLDITPEPLLQLIDDEQEILPGHQLSGNRLLAKGRFRIEQQPESWRHKLPLHSKAFATISYPLARRYGYFRASK